jgi:hypothetical protein
MAKTSARLYRGEGAPLLPLETKRVRSTLHSKTSLMGPVRASHRVCRRPAGRVALRGRSLWSVPPNIGRWWRNSIASRACAAHRNRASSTCVSNKNCIGYVHRSRRASRGHPNSEGGVTVAANSWRTRPSQPRASSRSRASASGPYWRQLFANLRVFSGLLVGIFALSRRKQGFESPRERQ